MLPADRRCRAGADNGQRSPQFAQGVAPSPDEVLVPVVYCLNLLPSIAMLTSPNRSRARQRTMNNTHPTNRLAIVLTEVSNCLVVRNKAARQSHHLNVASSCPGCRGHPGFARW